MNDTERGESEDGQETARNWLDGIYGEIKTAIKYPVFQPLSYGMNYISYSDAYDISQALTESGKIYGLTNSADSHLLKNSEWGAIAYLAKSAYGLNTTDIAINDISLNSGNRERTEIEGKSGVDSIYGIPGCTSGNYGAAEEVIANIEDINSTTGNTASNGVYTWNQLTGTKASTTGTIYGIYDLSSFRGADITSSYIPNGYERLKTYGASFTYTGDTLNTQSSKYYMAYPYDSSNDTYGNNYAANSFIYGDAIRETSTGTGYNSSWYGDVSRYPSGTQPFFIRGVSYATSTGSGLFSFATTSGITDYGRSFRVVLIVA